MAYFKDAVEFQKIIGGFFDGLIIDTNIKPKLLESGLIIQFQYKDPALTITIDCTKDPVVLSYNDMEKKPIVEMSMSSDIAHKFWHGKVNLVMALTRRQMVAKGPIPKILKLLPVIKPAYALYPEYLKKIGRAELIV